MNAELDAWLAEHAMGWKPHARNSAHLVDADKVNDCDYIWRAGLDWSPSNNPAAMVALLDRMRKLGFLWSIACGTGTPGASFYGSKSRFVTEYADTFMMAVALAAKKALEARG